MRIIPFLRQQFLLAGLWKSQGIGLERWYIAKGHAFTQPDLVLSLAPCGPPSTVGPFGGGYPGEASLPSEHPRVPSVIGMIFQ